MTKNNKDTGKQTVKTSSSIKKKKLVISHIVKPEKMSLEEWQVKLRQQVSKTERFVIDSVDEELCPGEYIVSNPEKHNEYKVVYRGANSEWNYCSCMDFKTSRLGTCKHIEAVKKWFGGKRGVHVHREIPPYTSVYLSYRGERCVKIRIGSDNKEAYEHLAKDYFDENHVLKEAAYAHIGSFLKQARQISDTFRCYKDAIDFIVDIREKATRKKIVDTYDDQKLDELLKVTLYPYQKEGIRFAAKAGKAIIADEMGLGKTIQAIGTAELLRKEGLIGSVLILCPTSLKYQWRSEIKKFTDAEVYVIEGSHLKRKEAYNRPEPYKIISYNSAANDIKILGSLQTDMLIMDEVQRLKNWNTQISRAARKIESDYSVILSGTPLENKLDELYSIVEFVDNFRLAPYYLFKEKHIIQDETGKVLGYQNLNDIGKQLGDILIRRRKKDVKLQMPKRMDKNLFVPMTKEQMAMHQEWQNSVRMLVLKWRKMHFLSDKDRKRLLLFLSQMRMVCDSSYILDQKTRYDTKVDECVNIISDIISEEGEKVVVFSQWERMTRLVAKELEKNGIGFEYLHGGVPSEKRKNLVDNFMNEPSSRVFLSTDAGSTGLNLQAAATIINIDLPWNPAVLEQRIGRIYRLGQQNNIQVINLVAPHSIEEGMLGKLRFKTSMFEGVLDDGEDTVFISDDKFTKMMETVSGIVEEVDENTSSADADTAEDSVASTVSIEKEEKPKAASNEQKKEAMNDNVASSKDISSDATESEVTKSTVNTGELDSSTETKTSEGKDGHTKSNAHQTQGTGTSHHPTQPKDLVVQGVSFLSGLAETLKSPEATAQLVDSIVEKDEQTGETSIKIPVESKETVANLFSLIGKIFAK